MKNLAKALTTTIFLGISTLSFAGNGGDIVSGSIEIGKNLTSKRDGGMVTCNCNSCGGLLDSSQYQNFAGGATNQNAGKSSDSIQVAVGGGQTAIFRDTQGESVTRAIQGGSATNRSVNQNAAAYAVNQNAELGGNQQYFYSWE